jgi:hypothetical protein
MKYAAALVTLLALSGTITSYAIKPDGTQLAQATSQDSAHTLVAPSAPSGARVGQPMQLPQGGTGITTGGTANYQTLTTPGGAGAVAVPNGTGTSSVTGPGGRSGTAPTPK